MINLVTLFNAFNFFSSSLKLGLIISIMVIGVHISYRILNCADLGIEGIFPLGGCVCAVLIYSGCPAIIATIVSMAVGAVGGLITALLHTKLKIPMILSGIITLTGFYSINLAILGLTKANSKTLANLAIESKKSIFYGFVKMFNGFGMKQMYSITISTLIISAILLAIVCFIIYYFFGTEVGMAIRATGDNPRIDRKSVV